MINSKYHKLNIIINKKNLDKEILMGSNWHILQREWVFLVTWETVSWASHLE